MLSIDEQVVIKFEGCKQAKDEVEYLFMKGKSDFSALSNVEVNHFADACMYALSSEHRTEIADDSLTISRLQSALYLESNFAVVNEIVKQIKEEFTQIFIQRYRYEMAEAYKNIYANFERDAAEEEAAQADQARREIRTNHIFDKDVLLKKPFHIIQGVMPL